MSLVECSIILFVQAIYEHIKDFPAFTSFVETKLTEVEDEAIYQVLQLKDSTIYSICYRCASTCFMRKYRLVPGL